MKYAWLTDIHLNFLGFNERMAFYQTIKDANVDGVFITGDIGNATSFEFFLKEIASYSLCDVYFILGNHDYYGSSVNMVRDDAEEIIGHDEWEILWVPAHSPYILSKDKNIRLVGHDCWADGRNGNYAESHVVLNDSKYIQELADARKIDEVEMFCDTGSFKLRYRHIFKKMQELADADAQALEKKINQAIEYNPRKIIILMHVPPFPQNAYYKGEMSDDNFLPFYSSKVTGDMLIRVCGAHPDIQFQGYCGHSHGASVYQALPNLIVKCGAAEYGKPTIQEIIEL